MKDLTKLYNESSLVRGKFVRVFGDIYWDGRDNIYRTIESVVTNAISHGWCNSDLGALAYYCMLTQTTRLQFGRVRSICMDRCIGRIYSYVCSDRAMDFHALLLQAVSEVRAIEHKGE